MRMKPSLPLVYRYLSRRRATGQQGMHSSERLEPDSPAIRRESEACDAIRMRRHDELVGVGRHSGQIDEIDPVSVRREAQSRLANA